MATMVVYRYGIPERVDGFRVDLGPVVGEQLRLAHRLRNDLVALTHSYEDAVRAVWSAHPEVAELEDRITRLDGEVAGLAATAARERSAQRGRGATASSSALAQARRALREARAARRDAIAAVRDRSKPELDAASAAQRAAVKDTYAEYCQDGVLYWATWNDVHDHHRVAVDRVRKARAAGQPASLRFHRFDGSGSIAVQLQRQAGMPPRTPATIADPGGRWRNVLHLAPWVDPGEWARVSRAEQRRARLGRVRFSLGHGQHATLPVIVHRMLPVDADITGARLVVRAVGGHRKVELHVTARIPVPVPSTGPAVAVHLGWRRDSDGGVRVATWRADTPVAVPPSLEPWVGGESDRTGWVGVPPAWLRRVDSHDHLRAQRDVALDKVKGELAAWLDGHGPVPHPTREGDLTGGDVRRWRSPARFAALALAWRDAPSPGGVVLAGSMEAWRRGDRALWEPQAHGRDGALAERDDAYRRFAAWITGVAGTLVVDDTAVSTLARRPDPGGEPDRPPAVVEAAARQRTVVAPGRLRELAVTAAKARGVVVETVPHTGTTRTHYRCGHVNPADGRYAAARTVTCDGCGQGYDQDASATLLMFAASGHVPPPGGGTVRNTA